MRKVSTLFKQTMEKRRDFYASAEIAFADGSEKTLEKRDFALSGNTVTESAESTSFPLGILAGRRISITLENSDDRWSKYDFFGAKIALKTCFDLPDGTTESLNIGTFMVISPESYGETVTITAMDGSYKADKPYTTARAYPMTAGVALQDACSTCDIDLATLSFANDNFLIQQAPKDITFRQYIGCIAMLAGGNAVMDEFDRLVIKSYDFSPFERFGQSYNGGIFDVLSDERYLSGDTASGGSFDPWDAGDTADGGAFGDRGDIHVLYQFSGVPVVEADDVVITGVQLTNTDDEGNQTTHLYGSEGYVLDLENPLTAGQESAAAALIGAKIVGLRFRPFSGNHIALPTAQFMDLAWILDRKDNGHQSVITDVDFAYFGFTALKCSADSPIRNSSTYYGQATKAVVQARQMVEQERTDRQKALDTLAQELAQSSGLYMTQEVQPDESVIYYMHDKPGLKDSTIVWKLTANALGISTDGGKNYPYGLDVTGVAILNRIYAIGLNADYIKTGSFTVDKNGKQIFYADVGKGEVFMAGWSADDTGLYKYIDLYPDMSENGLSGVADKAPVQYYIWLQSAKTFDEPVFMTAYRSKEDYLAHRNQFGVILALYGSGTIYTGQAYDENTGGRGHSTQIVSVGLKEYYEELEVGSIEKTEKVGLRGISMSTSQDFAEIGNKTGGIIYSQYVFNNSSNFDNHTDSHLFYGPLRMVNSSMYMWYTYIDDAMYGALLCWDLDGGLYLRAQDGYICSGTNFWSYGDIGCKGQKERLVDTDHYGTVGLNSLETPTPYFSDIGGAQVGGDGTVTIFFDPVFSETVDMACEYQVFLTRTSFAQTEWVDKRNGYFTVHGEPGATFDWMLCVPQRDYNATRLDPVNVGRPAGVEFDDSIFRGDDKAIEILDAMANEYEKEIDLL